MNQLALDLRQEKARLSDQCATILAWLSQGRCRNTDLAQVSLKYTGRISDLRKKDYDIRVVERNYATGETWYALFINGREVHR